MCSTELADSPGNMLATHLLPVLFGKLLPALSSTFNVLQEGVSASCTS